MTSRTIVDLPKVVAHSFSEVAMSLNLSIMLILLSVTALLSTSEANGARTFVFGIPQN
uniref:Uncharacterized protein n=1 Tax=Amphimedon queenslandica TaxID=400682 RepID=A0A1X7SH82_AMPQE